MDAPEPADNRHRNGLLGAALDAWEVEDGPFTESELAAAAAGLIDSDNDFLRDLGSHPSPDDEDDE